MSPEDEARIREIIREELKTVLDSYPIFKRPPTAQELAVKSWIVKKLRKIENSTICVILGVGMTIIGAFVLLDDAMEKWEKGTVLVPTTIEVVQNVYNRVTYYLENNVPIPLDAAFDSSKLVAFSEQWIRHPETFNSDVAQIKAHGMGSVPTPLYYSNFSGVSGVTPPSETWRLT
jgi:hypothetical protein